MKNSFDKNAEKFANLMVEKIESLSSNWSKPWFSKVGGNKGNYLPQNLVTGRTYSGGNAFLLFFLVEKFNYQTPIFLTFKQAKDIGICVLKGSESFPVYYTMYCAYNKETGEKITIEAYKDLTEEEQKIYRVVGNTKYYLVFNLDQTNYSEIFPEKWDVLKAKFKIHDEIESSKTDMYSNNLLDKMIASQSWICPIQCIYGDKAYWAFTDKIVLPLKTQFKDGESFYCTTLHEMAHSTGTKDRLSRKGFYERDKFNYGYEELVAELSSALVAMLLGISATVREENASYLKSWCKQIKEEPKFIFTVLTDAIKATKFIAEKLNISFGVVEQEESTKEVA